MKLTLENSLAAKYPDIAKEWSEKNPKTAYEIVPGSHEKVLWRCTKCLHEWATSPDQRTRRRSGCPACANQVVTPTNNLAVKFPEIAKEWSAKNLKTSYEIVPGSNKRVFWCCSKCFYEWEANPNQRTGEKTGCPACASKVVTSTNNLAVKFPEIAKEWSKKNTLTPDKVLAGSNKRVFWCCSKCFYEWEANPDSRTGKKSGCPACANKVVASTNNLAVTFPEIAKEWSEKNPKTAYETMPGSHERVFWRCSKCGHEWEARPNDRTGHGSGCPECSKGKAEAKVGELLKTVLNNLSLQALAIGPQYPVQIKGKRKSRFDFALIQDSSVIAFVEYDGRQHFQPVRWAYHISEEQAQEHLEVNQKKDEEKDKYAKDQGIPLIRTHYKEMEEFNKQVKQGIPETETCLYISLKAIICDIIRK